MSQYTFFGDSPTAGLAYSADAVAQAHGVTLGMIIGWTPSLAAPRRMIGFRQWITADQVAAGLDLTKTFTWILWAQPNSGGPLYTSSILARGNVSNLVVGHNDFYFPDQYPALVDAETADAGRYMLTFYYPPGDAQYSAKPNVIGTGTGFGQIISTVDPSGALYLYYGSWGSGTQVPQGGWISYGNPAGVAPQNNLGQGGMTGTTSWYGMDIIVDDLAPNAIDSVGISDSITVTRGGLPATETATGTATDPLSLHATASQTANIVNVQSPQIITRSIMQSSGCFHGAYPNFSIIGPDFHNDGQPAVCGHAFHVEWDVQLTGCYIFKPPLASGTIPVQLWKSTGDLLASTTLQWVADDGGWRQVMFDKPVQLFNKDGVVTKPDHPNLAIASPNGQVGASLVDATINQYIIGYFTPSGDYCRTDYALATFALCNGPLVIDTGSLPGGRFIYSASISIPTAFQYHQYWIDPIVQWTDSTVPPAWNGDPTYWLQWENGPGHVSQGGKSKYWFPIGVAWPDQQRIQQYYNFGVRVVWSGGDDIDGPGYMEAVVAAGVEFIPAVSGGQHGSSPPDPLHFWETSLVLQQIATNPDFAALVTGLGALPDEPDQGADSLIPASSLNNNQASYASPDVCQSFLAGLRTKDSSRPVGIGLDHICGMHGVFFGEPVNMAGDEVYSENERRKYARIVDTFGGDWYLTYPYGVPNGIYNQANWVHRLREICDDRIPVFADLETGPGDGSVLGPSGYVDSIEKSFWANVIAGVSGIICFDHWFPGTGVNHHQMDNYMLQVDGIDGTTGTAYGGDDSMRQMILRTFNFKETLGSAMVPKDLGLVTAWTSSNTSAGPVGGVLGVPIHFTTRSDVLSGGTHHYLFAQAIRPGATTATLTLPSIPNTTLTVLNESRTVTTDANGKFTDTFAADYSFHIYRW